jgi:hypothetical protein
MKNKQKNIYYILFLTILIIISFVKWSNYTCAKYHKHNRYEHFKRLSKPCPDKCSDKACCISEKLKIASDIMDSGIKKFKVLIPDPNWDGTRGNVGTLLKDIGAITSSTILTVVRGGKLVVDTGALTADLGSAFIQSVQ